MLRYKRLTYLSLNYGFIDHTTKNCALIEGKITPIMRKNFPYESWLNMNSDKGELIQQVGLRMGMEFGEGVWRRA